jgi:hypothetical protein
MGILFEVIGPVDEGFDREGSCFMESVSLVVVGRFFCYAELYPSFTIYLVFLLINFYLLVLYLLYLPSFTKRRI